ncbi:general odorant-binding protein 28a-like isoform X1 [Musca domestica]|uniref:General odorant-binding protein 28a-like n=2 Tax=Musca domestica TaxID=7370 RepID=A0A1I8MDD9_MUSDO|nr:general odorant-binding protein 28a-like isoform X1 [Musca domestica]
MTKLVATLAVVCIVGAVVVQGEFDKKEAIAKFMTKANECKTEVGATDADMEEMHQWKSSSTMEGKCLRACLMKKYQVMDDSGKFVADVAMKHAEKATDGAADKMKVAAEIVNACAGIEVSSELCQAAEDYDKCFIQQAKDHGIDENYLF